MKPVHIRLCHTTRTTLGYLMRIELIRRESQSLMLPLHYRHHIETLLFGFEPCSSIVYLRFPQCWQEYFYMVQAGGFEPTANRLKVYCSTNWAMLALCCLRWALLLLRWAPAFLCKARTTKRLRCLTIVLLFITNSFKKIMAGDRRIELLTSESKSGVIPFH